MKRCTNEQNSALILMPHAAPKGTWFYSQEKENKNKKGKAVLYV